MFTLFFVLWLVAVILGLGFITSTNTSFSYRTLGQAIGNLEFYPEYVAVFRAIQDLVQKEHWVYSKKVLIKIGNESWEVEVKDIGSRLNPNKLSATDLKELLENCGANIGTELDIMIDSFLDWIDKDDCRRLNGAEEDYYQSLPYPYKPRNGPIQDIREIKYIRGFANHPEVCSCFLSTLSIYGTGKIDINTAPKEVLKAIGMSDEEIKSVENERKNGIIKDFKDLEGVVEDASHKPWAKWISFKPSGVYLIKIKKPGSYSVVFIWKADKKEVLELAR